MKEEITFWSLVLLFILLFPIGLECEPIPKIDVAFEQQKLQILNCESGNRHYGVWGDNGKAYGIAQFHERTFNQFKTEAGYPQLRWESLADQLWLFDWALKNKHSGSWTCASSLRNKVKNNSIQHNILSSELSDNLYDYSMVDK